LTLKLFFTTDVHGSDVCWKKFLNSIEHFKVDIAILGGDITGKMVIPVVQQDSGYMYRLFGREIQVPTNEVDEECAKIGNAGYYPYVCDKNEVERLTGNQTAQDEVFDRLMVERLETWLKLSSEKYKGDRKLYVSPGNDDRFIIDDVLEKGDSIVACEDENVQLPDGYEMVTSGWVTPTPWKTAREAPDEKLEVIFEKLMSKAHDYSKLICNFHCPPYNSGLDTAPKIKSDLSVRVGFGGVEFDSMGSKACRKMIEKYKPPLGLHGHIHEAAGFRRIGPTLCVNPGSEYAEGILRGYLVFLDNKKVKGHWRVAS